MSSTPTQDSPSSDDVSSAPEGDQEASSSFALTRRRRIVLGASVLALVWGGAALVTTQHVFGGSTVSGIDVGGMGSQQALVTVTEQADALLKEPVTLSVGGKSDHLVPAEAGVSVDAAASVDRLTSFTLNPLTLVRRISGENVQAATVVDREALTSALVGRLSTLSTGVVDAQVSLQGTTPVITPAQSGTGLDVEAAVSTLAPAWPLGESSIVLAEGTAWPGVTDAEAQAFVDTTLTPLLAADLTVTSKGSAVEAAAGGAELTLTPSTLAALTTVAAEGGTIHASLSPQGLHGAVIAAVGTGAETPTRDASWTIEGRPEARPTYVAPATGTQVDTAALAADLLRAGTDTTSSRRVILPVTVAEPAVTTPEDQWAMNEVLGEYSTPFASQHDRDQNLIQGTAQVNATMIAAGATFSLEQELGPVDEEHGFAAAGVVTNGQHTDAMGGGLSQVATTVFNAGFEAGMDDVEHHPHSFWFDRYPAGRDSTLWTGNFDMQFRNSTPAPVLLQSWVSDGEVHARIWGSRYYTVSIDNGQPYGYRAYQAVQSSGPGCDPYSGGEPGFSITVTRSRTTPTGEKLPDDVLSTSYASDNPVVCHVPPVTPTPVPAAPAPAEPATSAPAEHAAQPAPA